MRVNLGRFASMLSYGPFAPEQEYGLAGISGGRTSALMHYLIDPSVKRCFDNTGLEDEATYEFLQKLEDTGEAKINWLEYRPPAVYGDYPRKARFEIVNFQTASRKGEPFIEMLRALAAYRKVHKGEKPVAPWARQRLCTSHLKHKVHDRFFMETIGAKTYESYIGLRYDEPDRVISLRQQETATHTFRSPLYDAKLTKYDIEEFWSKQPFKLEIPYWMGNCTGCFLKGAGGLSRALARMPESHRKVFFELEKEYESFGGKNFAGYATRYAEYTFRMGCEDHFKRGAPLPVRPDGWTNRRYLSVISTEKKFAEGAEEGFSCACENSYLDGYGEV